MATSNTKSNKTTSIYAHEYSKNYSFYYYDCCCFTLRLVLYMTKCLITLLKP
jgi:hypothetical protein